MDTIEELKKRLAAAKRAHKRRMAYWARVYIKWSNKYGVQAL